MRSLMLFKKKRKYDDLILGRKYIEKTFHDDIVSLYGNFLNFLQKPDLSFLHKLEHDFGMSIYTILMNMKNSGFKVK